MKEIQFNQNKQKNQGQNPNIRSDLIQKIVTYPNQKLIFLTLMNQNHMKDTTNYQITKFITMLIHRRNLM